MATPLESVMHAENRVLQGTLRLLFFEEVVTLERSLLRVLYLWFYSVHWGN